MRKMRRFRSSWACARYHLGLCFPFMHSTVSHDSVCWPWRPRSDCTYVQSDLGLHSPHVFAWCRPYYHIQRHLTCSRLLTVMLFYLSSDSSLFRALKLRTLCSVIPNFLLSIVLSNSISCSHDIHIWACWVCCGYLFLALLIRSKAILYCPFN